MPDEEADLVQGAFRLEFRYQGRSTELRSVQRTGGVTPPSDPVDGFKGESGFWYELRDGAGRTLYRRVVDNPNRFTVEAASSRPLEMERTRVADPEGVFVLYAPALPEAQVVALVSSDLDPDVPSGPATDLAVFDLQGGVT